MTWDTIASWNCKVGRDPKKVGDGLRDLIDHTQPDVICLQEAGGYIGMLKDRFGTGGGGSWYVYAKSGWDESQMNPVLVYAKGREWLAYEDGWNTVRYKTKWTGPQGGKHQGRTWTWVLVDDAVVMSFHRCTDGNGKNKAAFRDEHDKIVGWASHRGKPWVIVGDHNCGPKKTFTGSSKNIAIHTESHVAYDPEEPGIDYAIRHALPGTLNRLNKTFGSDHEATVFKRG